MEIKVNPNKKKTKIVKEKDEIIFLDVKAKPENNEANKEIIKFFSRLYGKNVKIIKGLKSRKKVLRFI